MYPGYKTVLFITASLVALSRVYLGLHYPSDIIAGAALGFIFGYLFGVLVLKIDDILNRKKMLKDSSAAAADI